MKKLNVLIIGAGFSGLASAALLAKEGHQVKVLEKNALAGGRAGILKSDGFVFDTGPSWYWMPDVFERYFAQFGKTPSDYYHLERLDPSYRFYFGEGEIVDVPASFKDVEDLFNSIEKGSGARLNKFLAEAEFKYKVAMDKFVYKPGLSVTEFLQPELLGSVFRLNLFSSFEKHIKKYFRSPRIRQMLEFPILFLGGTAQNTPALYSLMNYGDIKLGTWYPKGGMYKVVEGMVQLAESMGVEFIYNSPVSSIEVENGKVSSVTAGGISHSCDILVASADYHHVEQDLLPAAYREYSQGYWDKRVLSPSSLIYFMGIDTPLDGMLHHTLFFDEDLDEHARKIYTDPSWPEKPSIYFSCASKTDDSVAPKGMDNLFALIPIAPGLEDNAEIRAHYFELILNRIKLMTGQDISNNVSYLKSYALKEFKEDFNAYKGNAYGLANTLMQTAFLKPKMMNRKLGNLFYAGQLTVPGPGVPPALISGQIVAETIKQRIRNKKL
ncbi:MAG: phytoene desaturase [Bacteroidetes bacterium]|nr:phytoene desaturase [Bacteroidota bacterium]